MGNPKTIPVIPNNPPPKVMANKTHKADNPTEFPTT